MSGLFAFFKVLGGFAIAIAIFAIVDLAAGGLFTMRSLDEPAYVVIDDAADAPAEPEVERTFDELLAAADPAAGERVFKECRACHRVEEGVNMVGPSLHAVVGREVGTVAEFNYSDAFAGLEGPWTPEKIDAFITNPKDYAPGTAMTYAGLRDAEDRAAVIAYLQTQGD